LRHCRVLFAPSGHNLRLSCEILDHPDRIGRNGEEGAAADEDLTGLRQPAVVSPAASFLTRDPESCRDEPRGQRSPGNPRQGLRQIVEFTFDQICRDLGCASQLQKFRAPAAGAVCENARRIQRCASSARRRKPRCVSKQRANEMHRWSPPSCGKGLGRSALTRWVWDLGRSGGRGIGGRR
jgi:hypothetical protein